MEQEVLNVNTDFEPEKQSVWKSAMTYGLYYALVSIALTIVFYATGNMASKLNQWLGIIIMIAAVVIIQLAYRKSLGGYMSYGQALVIAILSMVFASIIGAVFTYVLYKFIDPGLLEQIMLQTEEKLYQQGMPEAQIETALAVSRKMQTPGIMAIMAVFGGAFMGLVIGAIAGIFTKKQSPDTIFN